MRKLLLLCLLPALAASTQTQAQLTASEKKLIAYVNSHMDSAIQLLMTSVNINSGNLNTEGVKKVGAIYAAELKKLGFTIEWVNEPDSLHRAGHLVAAHIGKKGKDIFLIGHLLDVTAKTGHSATILTESAGDGAIYEAARILNTFREQLGTEPYLTFNPGLILGGSDISLDAQGAKGTAAGKTNIISPTAKVAGDLRTS